MEVIIRRTDPIPSGSSLSPKWFRRASHPPKPDVKCCRAWVLPEFGNDFAEGWGDLRRNHFPDCNAFGVKSRRLRFTRPSAKLSLLPMLSLSEFSMRIACMLAGFLLALPTFAAEKPIEFNRDVRPILSENCFACHGPDARKVEAKFRFDLEKSAKGKASSGASPIVPGDVKKSEMLVRLNATGDAHMPPAETGKKLTPKQIATLTAWVEQGAKWEDHWSLTPIKRPAPPAVKGSVFLKNPIDRFVVEKLTENGLKLSPMADRVTLIRRVTFDLTGLPPTPTEVDAFVNDAEPEAYDKVVTRLLKSAQYGERMAMWWLDVARYADSVGYHGDQVMTVWPFRDYVIKSFNDNKRFDQFTREQLGGDLMPNATTEQKVASGYNRLGMMSAEGGVQPKEYLAKYASERVRAVSGGWLGLTTGCAECHDHKFDPITAKDFYKMEAFFADIQEQGLYNGSDFGSKLSLPSDKQTLERLYLEAAIKTKTDKAPTIGLLSIIGIAHAAPADAALKKFEAARTALANAIPSTLVTVAVAPRPIRVLSRGNWMDDKGELVEPGTLSALPGALKKTGRLNRLDLADWLMAKDNPLPSRVLANRLWKLAFGAGLSRKLDDLGSQGERPTHPELLDYLAGKLLDSDWDIKAFVKFLVTSETYTQSSLASAELRDRDPFNLLLARQSRFRLDAEMVRDNALAVSGLLSTKLGGPSSKPYQPRGYWSFLNFPAREWQDDTGDSLYRRGLYTHWQRQYLHPTLLAFDAPSREECTADRVRSNTPLQSLVLLNAPEFVEAARIFAEDVLKNGGATADTRLDYAFRKALSRTAKPAEKEALKEMLTKHLADFKNAPATAKELLGVGARPADAKLDAVELAAWTSLTRTVLNLHASVTRY